MKEHTGSHGIYYGPSVIDRKIVVTPVGNAAGRADQRAEATSIVLPGITLQFPGDELRHVEPSA